ncbi:MAG TPA: TetR/AcrR family transcriptional regulator [Solirubrobacteraceae bacterium]|nr:TetR/AcrR family transcriptional regulator [Solirubrobacteraceae bacterium]
MTTVAPSARLTDITLDCIAAYGVRKTSVSDVADRAGVSRSTVYRAFGGKEGLMQAVAAAEMTRFIDELNRAVPWDAPLPAALEQAVGFTMRYLQNHAAFQRVLRQEPEELIDVVLERPTAHERSLHPLLRLAAAERLKTTQFKFRVPTDQAAEWLLRVALSLLLAPTTSLGTPAEIADLILHGIGSDTNT